MVTGHRHPTAISAIIAANLESGLMVSEQVQRALAHDRTVDITTIERRSGQPRRIEIWFVEADGKYYILAEKFHDANWVRNIAKNPSVKVRVGDRSFDATARALDAQRDAAAWKIAQDLEREKYGWGDGLPVEITPR